MSDGVDRTPAREWLNAAAWIAIVIAIVVVVFAFVITGGFASCCTQPPPGFTPIPA